MHPMAMNVKGGATGALLVEGPGSAAVAAPARNPVPSIQAMGRVRERTREACIDAEEGPLPVLSVQESAKFVGEKPVGPGWKSPGNGMRAVMDRPFRQGMCPGFRGFGEDCSRRVVNRWGSVLE